MRIVDDAVEEMVNDDFLLKNSAHLQASKFQNSDDYFYGHTNSAMASQSHSI